MRYIYVGKSKKGNIKGDVIQLNDRLSSVKDVGAFIFADNAKHSEGEIGLLTTSLKVDMKANVGTISDIKIALRDVNALKINYSTREGSALDNIK